jgi:hypothetical protein
MGVTQATMAKLPPGPPVLGTESPGASTARRFRHSVQSKFTPRWPTFSNTKP